MLAGNAVFLVFHIGLLTPFKREQPITSMRAQPHLVIIPTRIQPYCTIRRGNNEIAEVLLNWLGLDENEVSWEDLYYIYELVHNMNLKVKFRSTVEVDVIIVLDM